MCMLPEDKGSVKGSSGKPHRNQCSPPGTGMYWDGLGCTGKDPGMVGLFFPPPGC